MPQKDNASPDTQLLADRFKSVEEKIEAACFSGGRSSSDITLVAVTKTFPLSFAEAALALGHTDFGENRVQELVEKAGAHPPRHSGGNVTWHMVGHIQRNKAKAVIESADVVHGLDSVRLAHALNKRADKLERKIPCFIQVNTSGEESKYGLSEVDALRLAEKREDFPWLVLQGLMTLARPVDDPEKVRHEFRGLRQLRDRISADLPEMQYLSMGMSGDFEVAIEEGATHVRLGTALFGPRS